MSLLQSKVQSKANPTPINSERMKAYKVFAKGCSEGLKFPERIPIWKWAEKHRKMDSKSSRFVGNWDNSRTPYLIEIMEEFSPHSRTQKIVFMKSSQIGGTEVFLNIIGYYMIHVPCPIMYVTTTDSNAYDFSTDKVDPLIDKTPEIKKKVGEKGKKNTSNSMKKN